MIESDYIIKYLFLFLLSTYNVLLCGKVVDREIRKVWRKLKDDVAVNNFFIENKSFNLLSIF